MIIDRTFWYKETPHTKKAFSYDNKGNVPRFVQQYGGKAISSLTLSDEVAQQLDTSAEVYSVLVNTSENKPQINGPEAADLRRFYILVRREDGTFFQPDELYASLKEANTSAKNLTKYYPLVLVLKKRVTNETVDDTLLDPTGVFI